MGSRMRERRKAAQWNEKATPISLTVFGSQIGNQPCRSLAHLPTACYERLPQSDQHIVLLYAQLLLALASGNSFRCERTLVQAARDLRERSGAPSNARQNIFFSIAGHELLFRLLLYPFESCVGTSGRSKSLEQVWRVRKICLDVLGDMYFSVPEFPAILAHDESILIRCFWFMENPVTFDAAVTLVEYTLLQRVEQKQLFDLRKVPNLMKLISTFSTRHFFLFSRVTGVLSEIARRIERSRNALEEAERVVANSNEKIIETILLICQRVLSCHSESAAQLPHMLQVTAVGIPQINLNMILAVTALFISERTDSMFWFWFGDIVENFLKESGNDEQELIAETGLMEHLVAVFLHESSIYTSCMQTDLNILGELIKSHLPLRERLKRLLDGDSFQHFCDVISNNSLVRSQYIQSFIRDYE